jgi:hypothetical protein
LTRVTYIGGSVVGVTGKARANWRTGDRRRKQVTTRYIDTPRAPLTRDQIRENTLRNDGLRAYNDTRGRLYT